MKPTNFTQNTKRAMKHFSFFIFLLSFAFALASCNKSDDVPTAPQGDATTFTLAVDGVQTRGTTAVAPARYVMEVWSEDGATAENVFDNAGTPTNRTEVTSGSITVALDKTKAYTCLFWADDNAAFDAASLKAISLNADKEMAEAYFANVAVAKGKNPAVAVTLKRAVAKITLTETGTVKTDDNLTLKLSNIYPTFSVLDGTATGTAAEWTKTINPSASTGVIATFYFFAKAEKALSDLTFTYATEAEKTVSNIPIQQNFATSIRGEFGNTFTGTFTVTADDAWTTPDNEVLFPQPKIGDYYYSDGSYSTTLEADKKATGMIYYISTVNPMKYKVVSLEDAATELLWSASKTYFVSSAMDEADGKANSAAIKKAFEDKMANVAITESTFEEAFPAAAYCYNYRGEAGTDTVGSWYLPAKNELQYLWCSYNDAPIALWVNGASIISVNANAQAAWDNRMKVGGSTDGIPHVTIWSSTDFTMVSSTQHNFAWMVGFTSGWSSNGDKSDTDQHVRCVRDI